MLSDYLYEKSILTEITVPNHGQQQDPKPQPNEVIRRVRQQVNKQHYEKQFQNNTNQKTTTSKSSTTQQQDAFSCNLSSSGNDRGR
jgi:hypothetical protein